VDQLAAAVDPEMPLHPKIPLVALLGLMHLRIVRLVGILGRRRRIDDGCIDDRAGGHLQPFRRPGAAAPRQTVAGRDRAPPAGDENGTPRSRPEPARARDRSRQSGASPPNRTAPPPPPGPTD